MVVDAGQDVVDSLGKKDLNLDGNVINLAIVGSSRFYDFEIFENLIEDWVAVNGYPDLIIVGGASGVDYMAERWSDNNSIPIAVFTEEWGDPNRTLKDRGRPEAANTLTRKILTASTEDKLFNLIILIAALLSWSIVSNSFSILLMFDFLSTKRIELIDGMLERWDCLPVIGLI